MARRILLLIMLVQLIAGLAIARAVAGWWPAGGWPAGLLLALASVLLVRMVISSNNFRMARRAGSAVPAGHALSLGGRLRLFWGEFSSSMGTSSWTMLRPRTTLHIASGEQGLPVLLVHGYGCNGGYWTRLAMRLSAAGKSWLAVDLEPIGAGIDDYAPLIEAALARLCAASGKPRAIVVGHSMGGLAARAHLRRYGDARVAHVITVGAPHHGTALANFGPGLNARQMQRGSAWLAELAASETPQTRALITSLWSHHDNIVAPQESARLRGAGNVEFGGIGHVELGSHPRVLRFILDEINRMDSARIVR
ncbi:alpha/beta fold hydrolase [Pseudoduganella sp. LjRoot289]|uniref:esterase/lipase family protein n=1 Tax=Pseudoduganella sp. LjRoot289 TaxID=3342314 RepID=UPI003ECCD891